MRVLISGSSGFIGSALVRELLGRGHELAVLSRGARPIEGARVFAWDGLAWPPEALSGAEAVIHLSGENIAARRWSAEQKKRLWESRVLSTRRLFSALENIPERPRALLSASAVGYYGDVPEEDVAESSPPGSDFLAGLCANWEEAALSLKSLGTRVAVLRTGIVLDRGGGALSRMETPFRLFLGGPLGSGRQWLPWIHRRDAVRAVVFILENPSLEGPFNLAAPDPKRMRDFCAELGKALGRPSWASVPALLLRAGLGEMAGMLLGGQRALPKRLLEAGFSFEYPDLAGAFAAIYPPRPEPELG